MAEGPPPPAPPAPAAPGLLTPGFGKLEEGTLEEPAPPPPALVTGEPVIEEATPAPVSYTHLTLPTILRV